MIDKNPPVNLWKGPSHIDAHFMRPWHVCVMCIYCNSVHSNAWSRLSLSFSYTHTHTMYSNCALQHKGGLLTRQSFQRGRLMTSPHTWLCGEVIPGCHCEALSYRRSLCVALVHIRWSSSTLYHSMPQAISYTHIYIHIHKRTPTTALYKGGMLTRQSLKVDA